MNGTPEQQFLVRDVFLTHIHVDHIASLPIFLENVFLPGAEPVNIYGHPETLAGLQSYIFNDIVWPDFVRLSISGRQFLRFCPITPERPVQIGQLSVLPVLVDHTVVTCGYIITDGFSTVIFGADSGPTERIWQLAGKSCAPRTVVLEACFPNSMEELAQLTKHLTPTLFSAELAKIADVSSVIAVHLKPRFHQLIVDELHDLQLPNLIVGMPNSEYDV